MELKCIKDVVLRLYYEEKIFNAAEIARKLDINPRTAQRHISSDPRYDETKKQKKAESEKNRKKVTVRCVKAKREKEKKESEHLANLFFKSKCIQDLWDVHTEKVLAKQLDMELKDVISMLRKNRRYVSLTEYRKRSTESDIETMHFQDVMAMSKRGQISSRDILEYCRSSYDLSNNKKHYKYNGKFGKKPSDLPERINTYDHTPFYEKERVESEKFFSNTERKVVGE